MGARELALACSICETRKEKRFCPAVHGRICPTCCGTEREVTLDCPSDCPYLQQARQHEHSRGESLPALFAGVELSEELAYRREPLLGLLTQSLEQAARRDRTLHDSDLIEAMTAVAKTYETLVNSGLVYETRAPNPVQQAISLELQQAIDRYREAEQKQVGYSTLRDTEAFHILVLLARMAVAHTSGRPRSRAFCDFLTETFGRKKDTLIASPDEAGSRLIIP
jgi:hypothetical protein